jgi:hypothetical protein
MSPTTPRRLSLVPFPTPPGELPALPASPVPVTLTHPDYASRGALQLPDGQILAGRVRALASAWQRMGYTITPAPAEQPRKNVQS